MATPKRLPTRISFSLTGLADAKTWQPYKYYDVNYTNTVRERALLDKMDNVYREAQVVTGELLEDIRDYNQIQDKILGYQKELKQKQISNIEKETLNSLIVFNRKSRYFGYSLIVKRKEEYKKAWKKVSDCKNAIDNLRASYDKKLRASYGK